MKESVLEMRFLEPVIVTSEATRAVLGAPFTEDINVIIEAQKAFRDEYSPTSLELHKEEQSIVSGGEVILRRPILVWEAVWVHGRDNIKPPEAFSNHYDTTATYPIDEYTELSLDPSE